MERKEQRIGPILLSSIFHVVLSISLFAIIAENVSDFSAKRLAAPATTNSFPATFSLLPPTWERKRYFI